MMKLEGEWCWRTFGASRERGTVFFFLWCSVATRTVASTSEAILLLKKMTEFFFLEADDYVQSRRYPHSGRFFDAGPFLCLFPALFAQQTSVNISVFIKHSGRSDTSPAPFFEGGGGDLPELVVENPGLTLVIS